MKQIYIHLSIWYLFLSIFLIYMSDICKYIYLSIWYPWLYIHIYLISIYISGIYVDISDIRKIARKTWISMFIYISDVSLSFLYIYVYLSYIHAYLAFWYLCLSIYLISMSNLIYLIFASINQSNIYLSVRSLYILYGLDNINYKKSLYCLWSG